MMTCIVGIRVTSSEARKEIKPEISVEKPRFSEDTGQLVGTKKVVLQKAEIEYRFKWLSSESFNGLIRKLKFSEVANSLYVYSLEYEFYIGLSLPFEEFDYSSKVDMSTFIEKKNTVEAFFPDEKVELWICDI